MTHIVQYLCIGGPLDGQWYAGEFPPSVPLLLPEVATVYSEPLSSDSLPVLDVVQYERRTLRQPFGGYVTLLVPSTMTDAELREVLNSRYPEGLK